MRRRAFISLLGGAAAWPVLTRAQTDRVRRIGVLLNFTEDDPEAKERLAAFRQGLERRGWSEGRNLHFDYRFTAVNTDRFSTLAKELIALQPDVILAHSTACAAALQHETHTIPIVFVNVSDPIGLRFVASLARPGGNLTGVLHLEASIVSKWLAMLKEIAPHVTNVALLGNRKASSFDYFLQYAQAEMSSLAIKLVPSDVETAVDIERSIEMLARVPDVAWSCRRIRRPSPIAISSLHSRLATSCRRCIRSVSLSRPAVSCLTVQIRTTCFGWRGRMSTSSCVATTQPTFRSARQPGLTQLSISKLPRPSV
jgi:putative ABC transport system substrate-binding protein